MVLDQANTGPKLLDLLVNRVTLQKGVVLFQLQTLRCVAPVFLGNVAGDTRNAGAFLLSALKDDLDAIAFCFLSHFTKEVLRIKV